MGSLSGESRYSCPDLGSKAPQKLLAETVALFRVKLCAHDLAALQRCGDRSPVVDGCGHVPGVIAFEVVRVNEVEALWLTLGLDDIMQTDGLGVVPAHCGQPHRWADAIRE